MEDRIEPLWHHELPPSTKALLVLYQFLLVPTYLVVLGGLWIDWSHPFVGSLFLGSELLIFFVSAILAVLCWRPGIVPRRKLDRTASVDVFITTIDEDPELLARTLRYCLAMPYPHETWILDDGNRPAVRALAEGMGARYLARADRVGAKAGNLNHALRQTKGELVAIFDADGIPRREFLDEIVGHFADPKVAVVQASQRIYNLDSFQCGGGQQKHSLWNEQSIFWDVIQSGRNRFDGALWCGSGAMLRRSAIEQIGGIPTDTVTEDYQATLRLQAQGYRVVFDPRPLSYTQGPRDCDSFVKQRDRWCRGTLRTLRLEAANLWRSPHVTWGQFFCAFAPVSYYFESVIRILALALPVALLATGGAAFRGGWLGLLCVPMMWLLRGNIYAILSRHRGSHRSVGGFWLIKTKIYVKNFSTFLFSNRQGHFFVTPKRAFAVRERVTWDIRLVVAYTALTALAAAVLVVVSGPVPGVLLALVSAVYHFQVAWDARNLQRRTPWVADGHALFLSLPVALTDGDAAAVQGMTRLVAPSRVHVYSPHFFPRGRRLQLRLELPDRSEYVLPSRVLRSRPAMRNQDCALHWIELVVERMPNACWDAIFHHFLELGPDFLLQATPQSRPTKAQETEARAPSRSGMDSRLCLELE
jgi:cellulose synthase/poly-beta-1,6-N-acetylglucosamine synthase-like glycosyltransferase